MDIRRKTTYLSRAPDGRHAYNYSSFFQSAQKKNFSSNPDSGMRMVGPMFELSACVELKGDEDDFDAVYPESSLSYGPTICSFGLKYNDHNYALPSGLTPPSMAPHLMDLSHPQEMYGVDMRSDSACSRAIFSDDVQRNRPFGSIAEESTTHSGSCNQTTLRSMTDPQDSSTGAGSPNESDKKSGLASSWSTLNKGEPGPFSERYSHDSSLASRYNRLSSGFEQMEVQYEPELKVIEVPDELAVSPSQLSDLDSDVSEDGYSVTKSAPPLSNFRAVVLGGNQLSTSSLGTNVRCICGRTNTRVKFIQCPCCNSFQHAPCMESYYSVSLPNLCEGYVCPNCGNEATLTSNPSDSSKSELSTVQSLKSAPLNSLAEVITANVNSTSECHSMETALEPAVIDGGPFGAQYVDVTVDRAKQLGLIPTTLKVDNHQAIAKSTVSSYASIGTFGKSVEKTITRDPDGRCGNGHSGVDWDRLNELSRSARRSHGDTNVNLRVPSPPRASKRKQDLTSTSYGEAETNVSDSGFEKRSCTQGSFLPPPAEDTSSASVTPASTPTTTPYKLHSPGTVTPIRLLTPTSECSSSSSMDSPFHQHSRGEKRRHKPGRVLFADSLTPTKRGLSARSHPLGAAWAKDYQEAECNAYSKSLLEHIEHHLTSGLERNYRIPPACLTRSSLCRVVLFDHDDKGLESSVRLSPNDVVSEVRGNLLLLEEYEHHVDPISQYNRYVLFYRGFSDRAIVVDTSQYGNSARFIRRSCIPNCRLDHCIVQDKLQLVIRTTNEIMPGTELTIPFDFDYRACRYPLDCACGRSRCPVLKWRRKLIRNKVVPNLDYSKYIESQLRVLSKPLTQESPNSKGSYDPIVLTGSPLMRSSTASQSNRLVSPTCVSGLSREERHTSELDDLSVRRMSERTRAFGPDVGCLSTSNVSSPDTLECGSGGSGRQVVDENERPDDSNVRTRGFDLQLPNSTDSATRNPGPLTPDTHEKLTFQPIITTRRQAAAMQNSSQ